MKKKIKPCKCGFCGKEPYVWGNVESADGKKINMAYVECRNCKDIDVKTIVMDDAKLAIEAWNYAWEQTRL